MTPDTSWHLAGMTQDKQRITSDWEPVDQRLIDGVAVQPVANVPTGYGYLCEVYRDDWLLDQLGVGQVFIGVFEPGGVSGWHAHGRTTDRLFVARGRMKIVLYDARRTSPTHGLVNQFTNGSVCPALVVVPPGVWHAVQNVAAESATLINVVDVAYQYERPDHYRLPLHTDQIPYRFPK